MYTGVYDDKSLTLINYVALETDGTQLASGSGTTGIELRESEESDLDSREFAVESEEVEIHDPALQLEAQPTQLDSQDLVQSDELDTTVKVASEDRCDCYTQDAGESGLVCSNAKLQVNTLVYIVADYYQIPELKRLALKKFAAALDNVCRKGLSDVCYLVYESAPSSALDLRSYLSNAIASNGQQLGQDASLMATALLLPELLRDLFLNVVRRHHIACNERDAAVTASLKAEDEAKDANRKGQEDKQRVITQVNSARQCRHCGLDNNVLFEREGSSLGRSDYSFRCRCRTRY